MSAELRLIAHRGVSALAPENTMAAFTKCLDFKIDWFEFDVEMLGDSSLVVMHDDTVDRTTNGAGRLSDLSFDDVRRLDAGLWFDPSFRFERVPELATVVELLNSTKLSANLEIKPTKRDAETQEAFMNVLNTSLTALEDPAKVLISSFSAEYLRQIKELAPQYALAYLVDRARLRADLAGCIAEANDIGCSAIHPEHDGLGSEQIQAMNNAGLEVNVWTVNDVARAEELKSWGVAGIISDCPQKLAEAGI